MSSVFVAVPYTRPHYGQFVESLLLTEMPEQVAFKQLWGVSLDAARNYLIDCFLLSKQEYLLFVDNDCTFHPGAINRLIGHNLPMVCGCMYTTTLPPKPTMGLYRGQSEDGKHWYKFGGAAQAIVGYARELFDEIPDSNALMFEQPRLFEIDGCGMHFTLIRRDVVETLTKPHFASLEFGAGGGEDFYFCRKVRDAGFPIYADLSIHTGHVVGEREGADFGLKELLLLARHSRLEDLVDVDGTDNWIVP